MTVLRAIKLNTASAPCEHFELEATSLLRISCLYAPPTAPRAMSTDGDDPPGAPIPPQRWFGGFYNRLWAQMAWRLTPITPTRTAGHAPA
jgi:hypothetical protein